MLKGLLFTIISFYCIGCGSYGKVVDEEVSVTFPIKVSLDQKKSNWEIDSTNGYSGSFILKISNIKKIHLVDLTTYGNFSLELRFNEHEGKKLDKSNYLFYKIKIVTQPDNISEVYNKLLDQQILYVPYFWEDLIHLVDMNNSIRYILYNKGEIEIQDLKELFSDTLKDKEKK